ncbi:MAG: cob(I)yrinic acid a,c-diamide adenosyltransferase [Desulfuromonadales bacterium]|nr:cob(I)yrinic acid a,c-diamide adenosyltransferase [Desulfuromonadales bacterium]
MVQGRVQVYTGNGKGKTTAAAGLAARALGHGWRVLWVRLLKPAALQGGELTSLSRLPGFELLDAGIGVIAGTASSEEVAASVQRVFAAARQRIASVAVDLVVFDEINGALRRNALPLAELLDLLDHRPPALEIVLTGRDAHPQVLLRADLVTEMAAIKHPLTQGIAARQGIEY